MYGSPPSNCFIDNIGVQQGMTLDELNCVLISLTLTNASSSKEFHVKEQAIAIIKREINLKTLNPVTGEHTEGK